MIEYPKNRKWNKHKALIALRGILEGLQADSKLNHQEIMFLDLWLKSDVKHINDGDIFDLRDTVQEILADGIVEPEELSDLRQQIDDVLDYGEITPEGIDGLTNQLLGYLQGITADGVINRAEVLALQAILDAQEELRSKWPGDIIHRRLQEVLEDDVVSAEEAADLYELLSSISGQTFQDTGVAHGMATQYFGDDPEDFVFSGAKVCFSGQFISGPRSRQERLAESLGANVSSSVTQKTNCLILGDVASRDWKFTSHGRKIEAVAENRSKGFETVIMTEQCWLNYVS